MKISLKNVVFVLPCLVALTVITVKSKYKEYSLWTKLRASGWMVGPEPTIFVPVRYANVGANTEISDLSAFKSLEWLDISDNKVTSLPDLSRNRKLTRIKVSAYGSGSKFNDMRAAATAPCLQELDIRATQVSDLSPLLPAADNLKALHLSGDVMSDVSELSFFKKLEVLTVNLPNVKSLSVLCELPRLQRLEVTLPRHMSDDEVESLLAKLTGLRKLKVNRSQY